MIKLGIISVQKMKSYFCRNKFSVSDEFGEEIKFIVTEVKIPKFMLSRHKLIQKRVNKAEQFLIKNGAEYVLKTKELCIILNEPTEYKKSISTEYLAECFMSLYNKCNCDSFRNTLTIYDSELRFASVANLSSLSYCADNIILYTKKQVDADKVAQKIFSEYGFWLEIKPFNQTNNRIKPHMLIDADRGYIRVADTYVDGVDYNFSTGEYDVDLEQIISFVKPKEDIAVKNLRSGKNLIKIS